MSVLLHWQLLAFSTAAVVAASSLLPIVASWPLDGIVSTPAAISLPNGFHPPPVPLKPLVYPFRKGSENADNPDWQPIVGDTVANIVRTTTTTTGPQSAAWPTVTPYDFMVSADPVQEESIVYGAWKPVPPAEPESEYVPPSVVRTADRRQDELVSNEALNEDYVNQQGFGSFELKGAEGVAALEVMIVNMSDPALLAMAQQINNSVETASSTNQSAPTSPAVWLPLPQEIQEIVNDTTMWPKNWPTDFTNSNEHRSNSSEISSESTMSAGDRQWSTSELSEENLNIARMGVPYEDQNSAEEPTICVPLTMRERTASNAKEFVNIERIYCFPLPQPGAKTGSSRNTLETAATTIRPTSGSVFIYGDEVTSNTSRLNNSARNYCMMLIGLVSISINRFHCI